MSSKAARRYAQAYMETAIEKGILEEVKQDMTRIDELLAASRDLKLFLRSPIVRQEQKKAVLDEIFGSDSNELTVQLLKLLTEKNRESLLEQITGHFTELYNAHHGIIEVDVTSAIELDDKQIAALKSQLERSTGKKVQMIHTVNEELIGGMMVRIDDTVIDGSVKFKLNQLKEQFSLAAVE